MGNVLQGWVGNVTLMQQTVLLTAIRGPDGVPKYGPTKMLLRWYRRCIVLSAMDQQVLTTPYAFGGGSFTGPSYQATTHVHDWRPLMDALVGDYLRELDGIPHHFQLHFLHAAQIPRFQWQGWYGDALTMNPNGGREMPNGLQRSMRQAFGHSTRVPEYDEVRGRTVTVQWLWLTIEICIGRVR